MDAIRNSKDLYEMVLIPAGVTIFGTGRQDPFFNDPWTEREKPTFVADVPGYYIGRFCVTNEQYESFVKETGYPAPDAGGREPAIWIDGACPPEKAGYPVVWVSWFDASAYCKWAGLVLPTELQWEKAARGSDGRIYPWGDRWSEDKLRCHLNRKDGTTCRVDDYQEGASVFGLFNTSGNVWEWSEDWFDAQVYRRYSEGDLRPPLSGTRKTVRGGSWHGATPLPFRCSSRLDRPPEERSPYCGFRCVKPL